MTKISILFHLQNSWRLIPKFFLVWTFLLGFRSYLVAISVFCKFFYRQQHVLVLHSDLLISSVNLKYIYLSNQRRSLQAQIIMPHLLVIVMTWRTKPIQQLTFIKSIINFCHLTPKTCFDQSVEPCRNVLKCET